MVVHIFDRSEDVAIPEGEFRFGVLEPGALGEGPDFFAPLDEDELVALWE